MFSIRVSKYRENVMLNICDAGLLGSRIGGDDTADGGRGGGRQMMHISEGYYGGNLVSREEASRLLKESSIINMVGRETISLAVALGVGSWDGSRT